MKFKTLIILAASLFLLASCNLDNERGIGSMVKNDQFEESFRSSVILGISVDSDSLYLKTDKGIRKYGKKDGNSYGFLNVEGYGNEAKSAWFADDSAIFIENDNGGFSIVDKNGTSNPVSITYNSAEMKSIVDSYTADGKTFTVLFSDTLKNTESSRYYPAVITISNVSAIDSDSFSFCPVERDGEKISINLSIIGDKSIRYSEGYTGAQNTSSYYYCNDITASDAKFIQVNDREDDRKEALIGSAKMADGRLLAVDSSGHVYIDGSYSKYDNSGDSITKLPIVSDEKRTLFLFNGKAVVIQNNGSPITKSATNLSGTMTPILLKKNTKGIENSYLLMTELSGAYTVTMNNESSSISLRSLGSSDNTSCIKDFF